MTHQPKGRVQRRWWACRTSLTSECRRDVVQPHALTLPCPHRRPALKEIKRSELLNVTSIEQVSGAALSLAELSAVFCIMPKLDTGVRFGSFADIPRV